jgi:hypothetical protein
MLNIKRHVRVSGPLQRSQNHSVYMRRAEATRAEKTPVEPSLDFSIPGPQNRVSRTPPTSEREAPKAEGRASVSSLKLHGSPQSVTPFCLESYARGAVFHQCDETKSIQEPPSVILNPPFFGG